MPTGQPPYLPTGEPPACQLATSPGKAISKLARRLLKLAGHRRQLVESTRRVRPQGSTPPRLSGTDSPAANWRRSTCQLVSLAPPTEAIVANW